MPLDISNARKPYSAGAEPAFLPARIGDDIGKVRDRDVESAEQDCNNRGNARN